MTRASSTQRRVAWLRTLVTYLNNTMTLTTVWIKLTNKMQEATATQTDDKVILDINIL